MTTSSTPESVIVGGGAAGRSAALVLGRARKSVVLVDAGRQANLPADGIRGLLGNDGTAPADFYAATARSSPGIPPSRSWPPRNGVEPGAAARWLVHLDDGLELHTDRILLATGMRYDVAAITGIEALWGSACSTARSATGGSTAINRSPCSAARPTPSSAPSCSVAGPTRVTVIEPAAEPDAADHRILEAAGIRTVQATIDRLVSCDRRLDAIVLSSGERLDVQGLLVAAPHAAPNGLATSLGVERTASGHVAVNGFGMTSVPGVWAAGDATSPLARSPVQ